MIDPKPSDIGRSVTFRGLYQDGLRDETILHEEKGIIERFNDDYVYVRFNDDIYPHKCDREDLFWTSETNELG